MSRRDLKQRWDRLTAPLRGALAALGLLSLAAAIALLALVASGVVGDEGTVEPERIVAAAAEQNGEDPFAYSEDREEDFVRGAILGHSQVLYAKSPGGVLASAKRTARFRQAIEKAAGARGLDADLMEAMVLLESAGRPEVIAGTDPAAASGLAQIVASTGIDLLGMSIDLERSRALTERLSADLERAAKLLRRAEGQAEPRRAAKLRSRAASLERRAQRARRERAGVDPRFDPEAALAGMARYLEIARDRFGREDLAVTSYHMGIGNLGDVIERYVSPGDASGPIGEVVAREGLSYAQLFFDSSPIRNPRTWSLLSNLADDSRSYWWRVLAAEEIMRLWREDRGGLQRLASLHGAKSTAEEVFHPEEETEVFDDPGALEEAISDGGLAPIPGGRRYGYEVGKQLGELAPELEVDPGLYRALRPEALATLIYMSSRVRAISGRERERLTLTSAVRDSDYQDRLIERNVQATRSYSLHTTGYSFDILRRYESKEQARAFQFVLDRLRALGVIDYAYEPAAIHVTVSERAEPLLGG